MIKVKVSYTVDNYNKYVCGTLLKEDEEFVYVRTVDNKTFEIHRSTIKELKREKVGQ